MKRSHPLLQISTIIICPVATEQHGTDYKNHRSHAVPVCRRPMWALTVAIFVQFWRNLAQTYGAQNETTSSLRVKIQ